MEFILFLFPAQLFQVAFGSSPLPTDNQLKDIHVFVVVSLLILLGSSVKFLFRAEHSSYFSLKEPKVWVRVLVLGMLALYLRYHLVVECL